MTKPPSPYRPLVVLLTSALIVAALYFGKPLLAPLAVAMLLAFLLAPVVEWLNRHGMPGATPVVLAVILSLGAVGGLGVLVASQAQSLLEQLPRYETNIRDKIMALREAPGTLSEEAQETLTNLGDVLEGPANGEEEAATPVTVVEQPRTLVERIAPILGPLTTAGLGIMLAFFILVQRRMLRDRIIHMFGRRNLTVTTRALDEAGERISSYLLAQGLINLGFGVSIGLGLYAIGVDFALLWGLLAALLRFVPYLGPWLAAVMPVAHSVATAAGWTQPLLVLGLFTLTELTINMVLEPVFYGRSAGLSPVALVLAISFWTLIWGPVGLFVATPLTVCVMVVCRNVPQLQLIAFLLGDAPVAPDDAKFYQRLLAHDEDEALQIALDYTRSHTPEETYDAVLLPAVSALKADRVREDVRDEDVDFGLKATRHIAEALDGATPPAPVPGRPLVLGCPASDELDVLALGMLRQLLARGGQCDLEVLGSDLLFSEMLARAEEVRPAMVCIGALAPGGLARAQLLCRRLRALHPHTRIVVGRWQSPTADEARLLAEAGADRTSTTLRQTQHDLDALSVLAQPS